MSASIEQFDSLQLLTDQLIFGEGPRWHAGKLWFSDIKDHAVKTVDAAGDVQVVLRMEQEPSGLGWLPDGRLLVVSMKDHRLLRHDPAGLVEVADLTRHCGGLANDMVVDAHGRAYIGNVGFDLDTHPPVLKTTNLVRVDPGGGVACVASDLMCPNGMAITADGRTLLVGQSTSCELLAFDIDGNGDLANRRVYGRLPEPAIADGLCLDAAGAVWVASPTTHEFLRMLPGGRITHRVGAGSRHAIACMLGGVERRTLYCITATKNLHEATTRGNAQISTVEVEVAGVGRP
jgi:sugar lactone lactonase YvrE